MTHRTAPVRSLFVLGCLMLFASAFSFAAEPSPEALSAFNSYVSSVESRLDLQHQSQNTFLALPASDPQSDIRLRRGELIIEQLTPPSGKALPGAILHHWRGTAFVSGAQAADFERLLKDFNSYALHFSPQVLQAKVLAENGDHLRAQMRVRQKHVITVVMDMTYDVTFLRLDAQHRYSISRTTQISEIDSPATPHERALSPGESHGFLWRMNSYWSYEERDGGLYIQIESISLTRSIPNGLAWAVGPFVESIPRDSLEFTLRSASNALHQERTRQ